MLQWGADWIYGIAAVMLLGTVALQATPEGTYQKYVRLFLGALLMLVVLSPLFSLFGLWETNRLSFEQGMLTSWLNNGMDTKERSGWEIPEDWEQTMREQVQKKQEAWLQEPLEALTREYGFCCRRYTVEWNEAGDWPSQLTLWVTRAEGQQGADGGEQSASDGEVKQIPSVDPVEQVGQDIEDTTYYETSEDATYYEPSELRQLHQALQMVWQLQEDQILLYWQR